MCRLSRASRPSGRGRLPANQSSTRDQAVCSPPFGSFLSEFTILRSAVAGGHVLLALVVAALILVIFAGMGRSILALFHGEPVSGAHPGAEDLWLLTGPLPQTGGRNHNSPLDGPNHPC